VSDHVPQNRSSLRVSFVLARSVGLLVLILPLVATISWPQLMQRNDYLASFYVAGRLVAEGRAPDLYPDPSAASFSTAPFNAFAHELLPGLASDDTAAYLYSPLVAWLFAPFSLLGPSASMAAWQLTTIGALAACVVLLASVTGRSFRESFWQSLLYLPVFQTLLIGHLGITFGLLPLCAGYFFLRRQKPLWGGLAWSLLLLKPQFLPTVLLVVGALTLRGRLRCLLGFSSGLVLLAALTAFLLPGVGSRWIASLRLGDTIFTDPQYRYPTYLVTCLAGSSLPLLPIQMRDVVKFVAYGLAALIGLHALWRSWRLMKVKGPDPTSSLPLIFLLGIGVLPLVVPHFLSYDLSVLAVAGIVMSGSNWSGAERLRLKRIDLLYLLSVDAYLVLFMFVSIRLAQPVLLVGILILLYVWLLRFAEHTARRPQFVPDPGPASGNA
jgi:hypothetical protein